ncbi:MAG: c-type cytochrome [Phycisphaerales bacterium]
MIGWTVLGVSVLASQPAGVPMWIWSSDSAARNEAVFFRTTLSFVAPPKRVTLIFTCDNEATIFVGDRQVASSNQWWMPVEQDLTPFFDGGETSLIVHGKNQEGPAGFVAVLDIETSDGAKQQVVTNADWLVSNSVDFAVSQPATELGPLGSAPWSQISSFLDEAIERNITAPPGFVVELVYTVPRRYGSWVSLTVDAKGRLITSAQSAGLYRITPAPPGQDASDTTVEALSSPIGAAQGLLCVDDDLYAMVTQDRAEGAGLYQLRDTTGDDQYDRSKRLRALSGIGEHGPHSIALGPDGMLYIVGGNHTPIPNPERSTVPRRWDEDHLLKRLWDPRGHAVGILAPGGWICRTDRNGTSWELFAIGFRNPYDLAFNADGDLFTYDADMEWDMGAPWYRPTRINHVVSGADFGWRSGTGKWPSHYPDTLPAVIDIGPGSPTGVTFGYGARFPQPYRDALFILDWTFGTIHAVFLEPDGSSYRATRETFLTGRPLPLTDCVINPLDGAMYFVVGGRGTPSALYRVRYEGDFDSNKPPSKSLANRPMRDKRRQLEARHNPETPASAIDTLWPFLGNADRTLRYSARVALEHQPVERWIDRAFSEPNTASQLTAMIALTRCGAPQQQRPVIDALSAMQWHELDRNERLDWLRCWALCFIRLGEPAESTAQSVRGIFEGLYPADDDAIDRELCDLLVYLKSPTVVARTIPLMERADADEEAPIDPSLLSRSDAYGPIISKMIAASPQRQQIHLAMSLRNAQHGWTTQLRERYFNWFTTASRTRGGESLTGFLARIRADALQAIPEQQRDRLAQIGSTAPDASPIGVEQPQGPGRAWTVQEVLALAQQGLTNRDFANGKRMYAAASCINCHRFAGTGQMGGPDLTALVTHYTLGDLIESTIEPSRRLSDQYVQLEFVLDDDQLVLGILVDANDDEFTIMPDLLEPRATIKLPRHRIVSQRLSDVSPMMPGLLDPLNSNEVLDLIAYLLASGDPSHPMFAQTKND